jgi:Uma2 family endonuclease
MSAALDTLVNSDSRKEDAVAVIQHEEQLQEQSELTIGEAADLVSRSLPGHRVEILQGRLIVTPPADVSHALSLTWLTVAFENAGVREAGLRQVQAVGVWLPTGPDDYSIPDLSVVEADVKDAHVQKNCYAPHVFRMVLEVTSSNWADDLGAKVEDYAQAGIPAYIVVDRKHDVVLVYTDPRRGEYKTQVPYKRGQSVPVPDSVGVTLDLSVDRLLDGDD